KCVLETAERRCARRAAAGVSEVARSARSDARNAALPALFLSTHTQLVQNPQLEAEVFWPTPLVVACRDIDEIIALPEHVEVQPSATLDRERG
ncbi:hypothetical protein ACPYIY_33950, partial [Burkholderia pseudomallei]